MTKTPSLLLFLSVFFLLSFSNKTVKNDYYRPEKFAGKVKEVSISSYARYQKQGGGLNDTLTWVDSEKIKYDKEGKEIEKSVYTNTGGLLYADTIKYDSKGNRLERVFHNNEGGLAKKILYRYDDNGRKIEEHHNKPDGSLEHNVTYKYDEHGNCTEWDSYSSHGIIVGKQIFSYDNKNNNTEEVWWFLADSTKNQKLIYTYNKKGQETERKAYTPRDSLKYTDTYNYDSKGNVIKMERFDSKGNAIDGFSNTYKYEYDKTGNWVKKEIQSNGKTLYLYLRDIKYY